MRKLVCIILALAVLSAAAYLAHAHGWLKGATGGAPPGPPAVNDASVPEAGATGHAGQNNDNMIVPVLYYHCVDDNITGIRELFISPREFDRQMAWLRDNGCTVITFEQLDRAADYAKPVIITFDDGYENNYTNAYPVLKKYGYHATIFLITGSIGKKGYLGRSEILSMTDLINFQSHTVTHPYLTTLGDQALERELADSKRQIESLIGRPVSVLAYPIGDYNQKVIEATRRYYRYAVVMGGGLYRLGDDPYRIKRVYVQRSLDLEGFAGKIDAGQPDEAQGSKK